MFHYNQVPVFKRKARYMCKDCIFEQVPGGTGLNASRSMRTHQCLLLRDTEWQAIQAHQLQSQGLRRCSTSPGLHFKLYFIVSAKKKFIVPIVVHYDHENQPILLRK